MKSSRAIFGLSLSAAIAVQGIAQAPHAGSTPSTTVFSANANLVLVDVVVTDHGNPVHGLDRERFHVLEDGHEQPIASFDEHTPSTTPASAAQTPLPPHTYTNVPVYPPASAVNVLLLDALNTPMANQMDVRRRMIQYLDKIPAGSPLAIFTLSSRLRMLEGFSTDAAALTKILKSASGTPQQSVILDPQSDQALDSSIGGMATLSSSQDPLVVAGVSTLSSMLQFQADISAFQTDTRVQITLGAMQQLARYLSGIPGRKNVIWLSGSFPIALDPDDALQDPFEAMRNYSDQIRDTANLLSAARVAVYPVDARGLVTPPTLDASYSPSSNLVSATTNGNRTSTRRRLTVNKPSVSTDDLNANKLLMQEQASMQQIADQTGGQQYLNTNGLEEAIASAIENGSSYYTIGYVPAAHPLDGQYRKIQINLESRNFKLGYRRGYYADPPDKPSEHTPGEISLITAATLHGAPPSTQILFSARVLPADDPQLKGQTLPTGPSGEMTAGFKTPPHRIVTDLKIDAHTLLFDPSADGGLRSKVEFTLVAYDANGKRVNYFDSGVQVSVKPGQAAQAMNSGIRIRLPLDLPAGQFFLRIAVHDLAAGRAGSLEAPVTVSAN